MIYTLTLNPSIDQHITIKKLVKDDKIKAQDITLCPGGKGFNVSRVVNELGGRTRAFGPVGGYEGRILKDLLVSYGIDHQLCTIAGDTRRNLVITDRSDGSQTRINPPGPRLDQEAIECMFHLVEHASPRPSYWALSGSIPPGAPDDVYQKLIQSFQKRGERCVLDADERPLKLGLQAHPFMIKPNEYELERLIGRKCRTQKQIISAGRKLAESVQVVAVSLAERGALMVTRDQAWMVKAPRVKVQSKVGAGDSFVAGFLTALDRGQDVPTASRWAVAAGTASVMREGTALGRQMDVKRLVKSIDVVRLC